LAKRRLLALAADLYVYCECVARRRAIVVKREGDSKHNDTQTMDDDDNDDDGNRIGIWLLSNNSVDCAHVAIDNNSQPGNARKRRRTTQPIAELRERAASGGASCLPWLELLARVVDRWHQASPMDLTSLINQVTTTPIVDTAVANRVRSPAVCQSGQRCRTRRCGAPMDVGSAAALHRGGRSSTWHTTGVARRLARCCAANGRVRRRLVARRVYAADDAVGGA
jgi:hypothetical protein